MNTMNKEHSVLEGGKCYGKNAVWGKRREKGKEKRCYHFQNVDEGRPH